MNQPQKDRLLAVIERDAEIREQYVNLKGQFCIIGGMLDDAGVNVVERFECETTQNTARVDGDSFSFSLRLLLLTTFGLAAYQLATLQKINDRSILRSQRQGGLKRFVNSILVSDE